MAGAVMQLIGVGEQEQHTTGQDFTYWKATNRKHTHFATQDHEIPFSGQVGFGRQMLTVFPRNGDLISNIVLGFDVPGIRVSQAYIDTLTANTPHVPQHGDVDQVQNCSGSGYHVVGSTGQDRALDPFWTSYNGVYNPTHLVDGSHRRITQTQDQLLAAEQARQTYATWTNGFGHAVIEEVSFHIGGTPCDTQTGEWMDLVDHFSGRSGVRLREAIGKFDSIEQLVSFWSVPNRKLFVPCKFWFCGVPGLSIPLIALHYHDCKLVLKTRNFDKLIITSDTNPGMRMYERVDNQCGLTSQDLQVTCYAEYVLLAGRERKAMANMNHQYLFNQTQIMRDQQIVTSGCSSAGKRVSIKLDFNHPICAIFWTCQQNTLQERNHHFVYVGDAGSDPCTRVKLTLNQQERFVEREAHWCRLIEPYRANCNAPDCHAYMISFALAPFEPIHSSGSCNGSKIETIMLHLTFQRGICSLNLNIYAVNKNVLRVRQGLGGPTYAA